LKDLIDVESALDSRFEVLLLRLRGSVMRLVKRIQSEFQNTDFIPVKFEAKIGEKDAITPIEISLSNDGKVIVEGAIDRVDEYELNGVKYVRVVDYKSGTKEFKLSDISFGLNMQMLLYLFTLCECENKQPAAVLYMPSGDKYVTANSNDDEIDIYAQRLKAQKMSGVVLNNVDVISAMEHNIKGVYLPVDTIKDGSISKKSSVISGEEFVNLRNLIGENLRQMGEALNNGDFYAKPTEAKEYNVCNYCPYINICGIDQNSQNSDTNE
jgi:ATP-dependent helicase/nuclease subunit B